MTSCSSDTSSVAHCPKSFSAQSSTMKVLFMLLPCPLTRSEGFSIELFGVQSNFTNTAFSASKGVSSDILYLERKGTCEPLSLGFTKITYSNAQQCCQIITDWETALHGCSLVSRTNCPGSLVRPDPVQQHFFSVFPHVSEILVLSSFLAHGAQR